MVFFFHSGRPPKYANVRQSAQKRAKICQRAPKCAKVINALVWQAVCVIQSCHRQSVTFGQLLVQRAGGVLSQSAKSLGQALKSHISGTHAPKCAEVRRSAPTCAKVRQSAQKCAVRQSAQKRAKICQRAPKCAKGLNALVWQAVCVIQSCHRQNITFGQLLVQRAGGVLSQSAKSLGQATKSLYFSNMCAKYAPSKHLREALKV